MEGLQEDRRTMWWEVVGRSMVSRLVETMSTLSLINTSRSMDSLLMVRCLRSTTVWERSSCKGIMDMAAISQSMDYSSRDSKEQSSLIMMRTCSIMETWNTVRLGRVEEHITKRKRD